MLIRLIRTNCTDMNKTEISKRISYSVHI